MSGRVCYLARADRGDGPATVRLVGSGTDDAWERPGTAEDPAAVLAHTNLAADWVAQRAAQGDGPRNEIALLCLDVDGATCSWLTAPSSDESIVAAAMSQGQWSDGEAAPGAWAPATSSEASVQALAAPPEPVKGLARKGAATSLPSKLAVASVPDVDARLFLDALDARSITVDRAISLWHAMAQAWDPAARIADSGGANIVANAVAPVTASVLIDPAGRLLWSWSRAGELIAAGSLRLPRDKRDSGASVSMGKPEIARVVADWLSWSVQLGLAPSRIVCVGPQTDGDDALTPAAIGASLTRAWPGATVDLAIHDDPIGATLRRLAAAAAPAPTQDGRRSLAALSRRPGRAHRTLYRMVALVVLALSVALTAVAYKAFGAAQVAGKERDQSRAETAAKVSALAPPGNTFQQETLNGSPAAYLREQLGHKRTALNPTSGLEPAEPILSELETLSLIVGIKDVELEEINLLNSGVMIYILVPDTRTGEDIKKSLDEIGTSHCDWAMQSLVPGSKPGKMRLTLYGKWKPRTPAESRP